MFNIWQVSIYVRKIDLFNLIKMIYYYLYTLYCIQVYGWGYNGNGQIGIGNNVNQPSPCRVHLLQGAVITQVSSEMKKVFYIENTVGPIHKFQM